MSTRAIVAAWAHIATGTFVVVCVSIIWYGAAKLAHYFSDSFTELIATFGRPVAVVLLAFFCFEILAAVAFLGGKSWARGALLVVSSVLLPVFPVGTALFLYSLWAL